MIYIYVFYFPQKNCNSLPLAFLIEVSQFIRDRIGLPHIYDNLASEGTRLVVIQPDGYYVNPNPKL